MTARSINVIWSKPLERTGKTTYEVTVNDVIFGNNSTKTCIGGMYFIMLASQGSVSVVASDLYYIF